MRTMKKAVVIIPTYNEKANISKLVQKLQEVFVQIQNWEMSILVVDDTSPDKTYEIVEKLSEQQKNVHLLVNQQKAGLGAAYLKGMAQAFGELGADVVFEFDADLSHDPEKIPEFLLEIEKGADFVLGSRYIKGGGIPTNWGLHRKFLSVVGNLFINFVMLNFSIRDWTTGYRALTREVYETVHPLLHSDRFTGYTFQIGFLHAVVRRGFVVREVPFKFIDRTSGKSKLGPEYIKNTLLFIFKVRLQEILQSKVFKFLMVGGLGTLVQIASLFLWRMLLPYQLAVFMSIETAIVSNFLLNNLWTFSDLKLSVQQMPLKFIQFNVASAGSIIIQQLTALIGEFTIGIVPLFTLPVIGLVVDTGLVYVLTGIIIGMFWNFFAYNKFIWKKK